MPPTGTIWDTHAENSELTAGSDSRCSTVGGLRARGWRIGEVLNEV
jgi:hypothetical protein